MKNQIKKASLTLLVLCLSVISYGQTKAKSTSPQKANVALSSIATGIGKPTTIINFSSDKGKYSSSQISVGTRSQKLSYTYNEKGSLVNIADSAGTLSLNYIYDDSNRLLSIEGKGGVMTRKFEYDAIGRIVKQQIVTASGKVTNTHQYTYNEKGAPVTVTLFDAKDEKIQTYTIAYDNKKNPFKGVGALANTTELMLGFPVAEFSSNVVKYTTTYEKKTAYKINDKYMNPGDKEVKVFTLMYNKSGYPTSISFPTPSGKPVTQTLTYSK
jgi:hypothetical protein